MTDYLFSFSHFSSSSLEAKGDKPLCLFAVFFRSSRPSGSYLSADALNVVAGTPTLEEKDDVQSSPDNGYERDKFHNDKKID